ncbi:MAG TPA: DUF952 domain-containing protein [Mycobacteriales bacterium]|nr:DUF952 domain-containing protein [Mycobacteriales bacterium]
MASIYHIASAADWQQAQEAGEYRISTRGRTLEEEGFIHASAAHQVERTANAFYAGLPDLLVLEIDSTRVVPEIRYERAAGTDEDFPHIYAPLNADAVTRTLPLRQGAGGSHIFTL